MQQAYGSSNASAATYMNSSNFYNASTYPYSPLSSARTLNQACKTSAGYLSSAYTSPASPFQSAGHSQGSQYSPYTGYNTPGTSFAQGFTSQVKAKKSIVNFLQYLLFRVLTTVVMEQHILMRKLIQLQDITLHKVIRHMLVHLVLMEVLGFQRISYQQLLYQVGFVMLI